MPKTLKTVKPSELNSWKADINAANKRPDLQLVPPVLVNADGSTQELDRNRAAELAASVSPVTYEWNGVRWTMYCDMELAEAEVFDRIEAKRLEMFEQQDAVQAAIKMAATGAEKAGVNEEDHVLAVMGAMDKDARARMMKLQDEFADLQVEAFIPCVVNINDPNPAHFPTLESLKKPFGLGRVQREALLEWANFT